ncbi:unnamed protein product, partial [Allacma fusca]
DISFIYTLLPDFDVTETSVPWRLLTNDGVKVDFATESGQPGQCDPLLLTGVVFGQLGGSKEAIKFHSEMIASSEYQKPLRFDQVDFSNYDAILLPGGHAQGMKPYLENTTIQEKIVPILKNQKKIVAAVCHGVIVLARTIDPATGKSVLFKRKSTCLPKYMERTAYYLTAWKLGRYYRTYEAYVEDEVKGVMENPKLQFEEGTPNCFGSRDEKYAYVCIHDNYISARWPGDAYAFGRAILEKLHSL